MIDICQLDFRASLNLEVMIRGDGGRTCHMEFTCKKQACTKSAKWMHFQKFEAVNYSVTSMEGITQDHNLFSHLPP